MNLVLVRPPFYALFGVTAPKMKMYPLNLMYLATYARDVGDHEVVIVDGENVRIPGLAAPEGHQSDPETVMHQGIPGMIKILEDSEHPMWLEMEHRILAENPDLVGITCTSGNMDAARVLVGRLKRNGVPLILGGSHPTVLPEQSLEYTSADMVAVGEGEITLVHTMDALRGKRAISDIPSLAWQDNGRVKVNPRGALIDPLDEIPIPDRSFIDRSNYFGDVIITGRGCPFNCTYCASRNIWGKRVRFRSVESVVSELEIIRAQVESPDRGTDNATDKRPGNRVIKVVDDTFTVNRKRTLELLDEIIARGLNSFEFTGGVRADTLDERVVEKMSEANFRRVTLGVESGSPRILKMIRKGETNEEVKRALKLLRSAGIHSHAFFMIGLPEETPEDIELSKKLILEARPDHVEINMVTPYPGTALWTALMSEDPAKVDRWYRWFHQGMATHSDRLGYDLDRAYEDFLDFAREYHEASK